MVRGLDVFKEFFSGMEENYVIIGGTACNIHEEEMQQEPRATKDIDLVLIVEALSDAFVRRFWEFIKTGGYEQRQRGESDEEESERKHEYFRFIKPAEKSFPKQIELFSRNLGLMDIPEDAHITPIPAGDIGYLGDDNYTKHPFWELVADQFEQVLVVPGNHEFYKYYDISSLQEGELVQIRSNVKVYYNAIVNIGDVDMILSTLWAHIPLQDAFATESGVTDFHRIMFEGETLTFEQFNKEHERCMDFLRRACKSSSASRRVIVTHHVPSFQLSSPDFKGSRINGAFVSNEDDFIETCGADYWIYGHSHRNIDKLIGKTRCVSNQLGYVFAREYQSFVSGKTLVL